MEKSRRTGSKAKEVQVKKFDNLHSKQHPAAPQLNTERLVLNLSSVPLDDNATAVLSKGFNYSITTKTIPKEEIVSSLEAGIHCLPSIETEEIRNTVATILKNSRPPKQNFTRTERETLKNLKNDTRITILPADKGNATVVLNTEDYHQKVHELLEDNTYKSIRKNPTKSIERKIATAIKNSSIPDEQKKKLIPSESRTPQLYCLPKIHKPDNPLRPIVSAFGSPTHALARHLADILKTMVGKTDHHIINSSHFIDKLKDLRVDERDILVSFDVTSLFTKIPTKEAVQLARERFETNQINADLANLIELCINSTYFAFNEQLYEQTEGMAMGSPLSPALANLFMEAFEENLLENCPKKPKCWFRYVDDTFLIWQHGAQELVNFQNFLNDQHSEIQFTMESEKDGALPFLDVLVKRKPDGTLGHQVYRKPTHTNRYLNAQSNHHPAQKQSVINTLIHRAKTLSEVGNLHEELATLKEVLISNGFTSRNIERAIQKNNNKSVTREKKEYKSTVFLPYIQGCTDKVGRVLEKKGVRTIYKAVNKISQNFPKYNKPSPLETPGIYSIPCSCGKVYIGETGRHIKTRLKEHISHTKHSNTGKSAIAEHSYDTGHVINFEETKKLATVGNFWPRKHRESIEIYKNKNNINRDHGLGLAGTWKPIFHRGLIQN